MPSLLVESLVLVGNADEKEDPSPALSNLWIAVPILCNPYVHRGQVVVRIFEDHLSILATFHLLGY